MLIENGNYTLATEKVKEALAAFRDAYRAMCRIAGKFMAAVETQTNRSHEATVGAVGGIRPFRI